MTIERTCVTHMDSDVYEAFGRPRRCVKRGQHYAACEHPDTCRGCVPRSTTWGFLCPVHEDKFRDALARVAELTHHLRSIEKAGQPVGERVDQSASNRLVVPETWIAADGLMEALGFPPIGTYDTIDQAGVKAKTAASYWAVRADDLVNTVDGAARATVLIERMHRALIRWPDSEAHYRRIPYMLCPKCRKQSLFRRAPLVFRDDILVECGGSECDYTRDWFEWAATYKEAFAALEREQKKQAKGIR